MLSCFSFVRSKFCERDISGTPFQKFFKYGTNIFLDPRMNWLDLSDQFQGFLNKQTKFEFFKIYPLGRVCGSTAPANGQNKNKNFKFNSK